MGNIPLDILIFAVIAIVLGLKLKNTLGKQIGHTQKLDDLADKLNPSKKTTKKVKSPENTQKKAGDGKPLSQEQIIGALLHTENIKPKLKQLMDGDRNFDPESFVDNAKQAFTMIFQAFAEGDKETLAMLLTPDINEGFADAIDEREKLGHQCKDKIIAVKQALISDIGFEEEDGKMMVNITVLFESEQINASLDGDGKLVDGDEEAKNHIDEYWTFSRPFKSSDPLWALSATYNEVANS